MHRPSPSAFVACAVSAPFDFLPGGDSPSRPVARLAGLLAPRAGGGVLRPVRTGVFVGVGVRRAVGVRRPLAADGFGVPTLLVRVLELGTLRKTGAAG